MFVLLAFCSVEGGIFKELKLIRKPPLIFLMLRSLHLIICPELGADLNYYGYAEKSPNRKVS